ncbi:hypothetical protein AL542_04980 [Grimontia hollisae]|uniref:Uncharacterized protein n=1 Tax=Grimontia hollisae CIP 101886 TaxID=675812 RepID=D0IC19_GRIHO|nr:hypothetical protein [Grimontia hollisae]AMG29809.1 hypothetical protein AL542_04980 [Grimontia hollisae]EEY71437.1 hypothetical protein VHA_003298 [Grimontia hollisae CIP 101886]STO43293.1 Uncharacterised protein [Grimontia hollisae]
MKFFSAIKIIFRRLIQDFYIIREIHALDYVLAGVQVYKLSFFYFLGGFLNMLVMFLPIKVFLLMSGVSQISKFTDLRGEYGSELFVTGLVFLISSVYLVNILVQLYTSRLEKTSQKKLVDETYRTKYGEYGNGFVCYSFRVFSGIIGDIIMFSISTLLFFFVSPTFCFIFLLSQISYLFIVKYFVYTNNKFRFLDRMHLEKGQANNIISSSFFIFLFGGIVFSFHATELSVGWAILLLLLSRIANNSTKGMLNKIQAIKKKLKRI